MRYTRLSILLLTISLPAFAVPIATVNGVAIDKKELDSAVSAYVQNAGGQVKDSPALREKIRDSLITREVLLQEAKKQKLDQQPQFVKRLDQIRNDMMRESLLNQIAQGAKITDAQVKQRYDQVAQSFSGTKEVRLSQIVLKTKTDAEQVITKLRQGAKFDTLVRSSSIDPMAKQNRGDMGWGNLAQMGDKTLSDALSKLKKGEFTTTPIASPQGWHVIKIEDSRIAKAPPFKEAQAQVRRQLQEEYIEKEVDQLRRQAKVQ